MAGFTPLTGPQIKQILVNQFQASLTAANVPLDSQPDTGPDSVVGAQFDALTAISLQIQYQALQDQAFSRLATTPSNPDGTVSAEAASYTQPFGVPPALGSFATSNTFVFTLSSLSSLPIIISDGLIVTRNDGVQYVLVADAAQPAYNGSQGYTIPPATGSITVTCTCLTQGSVGNVPVPANATWEIYGGPGAITAPAVGAVSNPSPILSGTDGEQQTAYIARFALAMQNGKWGTETAIIAAALGVQGGLIVSYGDHVDEHGTESPAYFTLVVNIAGAATDPSGTLLTNIATAIKTVRSGGIEYQVIAPTLVTPVFSGNVAHFVGSNQATVLANVQAAVQNAVNNIGMDQMGGTTTLSYAQTLALMISIPGVNPVGTTLLINGTTSDVTAPFASQLVLPTLPPFTSS